MRSKSGVSTVAIAVLAIATLALPSRVLAAPTIGGVPLVYGTFGAGSGILDLPVSSAGTILTVNAATNTDSVTLPQTQQLGVPPSYEETIPLKTVTFSDPKIGSANASASYTGSVVNGIIHVNSTGMANDTAVGNNSPGAAAAVGGALFWYDSVTVVTSGTLTFTAHDDGVPLANGPLSSASYNNYFEAYSDNTMSVAGTMFACGSTGMSGIGCVIGNLSNTLKLSVRAGDQLFVEGVLQFQGVAGAVALAPAPTGNFDLNLADSSYFNIDASGGASYTTASGLNYATGVFAVPEPATCALMLLGVAGVAGVRRRALRPRH
jgi:hypothetical protein